MAEPADPTAVLQSLLDAGQPFPDGDHVFDSPLTISRNLVGSHPQRCRLIYTGPPDLLGCVRIASGNWGYNVEGVDLSTSGTTKQGVGFGLATDGPTGTQSGGAVWERVSVYGFDAGIRIGDAAGQASSELEFHSVQIKRCNIGIAATAWNTLDLWFYGFGLSHCGHGLVSEQAGSIHIDG